MSYGNKYNQLFEYLSAADLPKTSEAAIVFGRDDLRVARALGDLIIPDLVTTAVITGGVGKDSSGIIRKGYRSEARFLGNELIIDSSLRGYNNKMPSVIFEDRAATGDENAKFSLEKLIRVGIGIQTITAVAHATSARRLAETTKIYSSKLSGADTTVHVKPTAYNFDPSNPVDTYEATAEFKRLMSWAIFNGIVELPPELVDFVTDLNIKTPKQPSSLATNTLRSIYPLAFRVWLMKQAAKV